MAQAPTAGELMAYIAASGIGIGTETPRELHTDMRARFGYRADYPRWLEVWNGQFQPNQPMLDLLPELRKEFRLGICSNTNAAHWDFIAQHYGLTHAVDSVTVSHLVGSAKPALEIYAAALKAAGHRSDTCLFVDDTMTNIIGANAAGLTTHLFTGVGAFQAAIETFRQSR
jgi:putative hydrolase of the HAD superfamily